MVRLRERIIQTSVSKQISAHDWLFWFSRQLVVTKSKWNGHKRFVQNLRKPEAWVCTLNNEMRMQQLVW